MGQNKHLTAHALNSLSLPPGWLDSSCWGTCRRTSLMTEFTLTFDSSGTLLLHHSYNTHTEHKRLEKKMGETEVDSQELVSSVGRRRRRRGVGWQREEEEELGEKWQQNKDSNTQSERECADLDMEMCCISFASFNENRESWVTHRETTGICQEGEEPSQHCHLLVTHGTSVWCTDTGCEESKMRSVKRIFKV